MRERVAAIHALSRRINGEGAAHKDKLLSMIAHHADEIRALCAADDPHAYVETGDLMVLCMELLLEGGKDPEAVLEHCCGRFEKKLTALSCEREPAKK